MIEIKREIGEIKQNAAADCKWIWVHKDLICILCLTLMALWLLKYAHQAGNIWIVHNDVQIYGLHCLDRTGLPLDSPAHISKHTTTHISKSETSWLFIDITVWKFCTSQKPICKSLCTTISYKGLHNRVNTQGRWSLNICLPVPHAGNDANAFIRFVRRKKKISSVDQNEKEIVNYLRSCYPMSSLSKMWIVMFGSNV